MLYQKEFQWFDVSWYEMHIANQSARMLKIDINCMQLLLANA